MKPTRTGVAALAAATTGMSALALTALAIAPTASAQPGTDPVGADPAGGGTTDSAAVDPASGADPAASIPDPSTADPVGWVRLAHLSPDTAPVDVRIVPASGSPIAMPDLPFGGVSQYVPLPAGDYSVVLTPAGHPGATPVLERHVTVDADQATTVTVSGLRSALAVGTLTDSPSTPAAGSWRVRVVNASGASKPLSITSAQGVVVSSALAKGGSSAYATLGPGDTSLTVRSGSTSVTVPLSPAAQSSATVFLVRSASGGITGVSAVDSAAGPTASAPGIQTGGGWAATNDPAAVTARHSAADDHSALDDPAHVGASLAR